MLRIDIDHVEVCMLTNNEELVLQQTLPEIAALFPKFVVLDQCSSDLTAQIVRDILGNRVKFIVEDGDYISRSGFAAARNRVSGEATLPWLFHIDADEQFAFAQDTAGAITSDAPADSFYLNVVRRNLLRARGVNLPLSHEQIASAALDSLEHHVRIYRNDPGISWKSFIHEELWRNGERVRHDAPLSNAVLHHLSFFKDFNRAVRKEEYYGWMLCKGEKAPPNSEYGLSSYSIGVLDERREYFEGLAAAYERRRAAAP